MYDSSPLITATTAYALWQNDPDQVRFVDCRFALQDPDYGSRAFARSHLPTAVFAHLDHDLSSPIIPGRTGRHPLPEVATFEAKLQTWGIHDNTRVIAYDDTSGVFASRLWWMLRWLGHTRVSVLDGGLAAWTQQGYPLTVETATPLPGTCQAAVDPSLVVEADAILNALDKTGGSGCPGSGALCGSAGTYRRPGRTHSGCAQPSLPGQSRRRRHLPAA